jgi:hypothetical protein
MSTVKEIATSAGAQLSDQLCEREIVALEALHDGSIQITLAGGLVYVAPTKVDLPEYLDDGEHLTAELLCRVMPIYPPGRMPIGVPFFRKRVVLPSGVPTFVFCEAGR